ncbi:hypothetical protein KLP40_08165 [Hymenobacter sp. NST-14]|uniref:beta-ketoacyl synthase N-terminal-like domain-containing protein n=1 Tax=Hymenobacter piscis TaxID=2839984 RepID=UPI001C00B0CB|nr:beta-ketoacyl synthase N-terminal-like domain-containing protein [Hymenobacter piscis]MBT9393136.1 hypothetical protein [Hymenobacter piscis]
MRAYINSIHSINPYVPTEPVRVGPLTAPDPAYADVLSAGELRRTPRLVKMGLYAATHCLTDAGLSQVDAITVGSGLGSFDGFEKFETSLLEHAEETIPPTPFIQSLDNAVAGQLALRLQCYGYNMTYTHRGFSFETALLDGLLLLNEPDSAITNVLVGGLDESTSTYTNLLEQAGHVKAPAQAGPVERSTTSGVQPGEGATFLVLSANRQPGTLATVRAVRTLFNPRTDWEVTQAITDLLQQQQLSPAELDLVLVGQSGDAAADQKLRAADAFLPVTPREYFKNYCGEYHTATAFAVWLGVRRLNETAASASAPTPTTCLIINHYRDVNYSFILLDRD